MKKIFLVILVFAFGLITSLNIFFHRTLSYILEPDNLLAVLEQEDVYESLLPSVVDEYLSEDVLQDSGFGSLEVSDIKTIVVVALPEQWLRPNFEKIVTQIFRLGESGTKLADLDLVISMVEPKQRFIQAADAVLADVQQNSDQLPACGMDQLFDLASSLEATSNLSRTPMDVITEMGCWPEVALGPQKNAYILEGGIPVNADILIGQLPSQFNLLRFLMPSTAIQYTDGDAFELGDHERPITDKEMEYLTDLQDAVDDLQSYISLLKVIVPVLYVLMVITAIAIMVLASDKLGNSLRWAGKALAVAGGGILLLSGIPLAFFPSQIRKISFGDEVPGFVVDIFMPVIVNYVTSLLWQLITISVIMSVVGVVLVISGMLINRKQSN